MKSTNQDLNGTRGHMTASAVVHLVEEQGHEGGVEGHGREKLPDAVGCTQNDEPSLGLSEWRLLFASFWLAASTLEAALQPGGDATQASPGLLAAIAIAMAILGVSLVESCRDPVDDPANQPLDGRGLGVVVGNLVATGHVGVET